MPRDQQAIEVKIKDQLSSNPVLLYMKGNKSFPQCGFSARVLDVLNQVGISYETVDILEDVDLRQGLKIYANWPTFPQLYVKGELIGGSDIVVDMHQKGELVALFKDKGVL